LIMKLANLEKYEIVEEAVCIIYIQPPRQTRARSSIMDPRACARFPGQNNNQQQRQAIN